MLASWMVMLIAIKKGQFLLQKEMLDNLRCDIASDAWD